MQVSGKGEIKRGRKNSKLSELSECFMKRKGKDLIRVKFADDKARTLALKLIRRFLNVLPEYLHKPLQEIIESDKKYQEKAKEAIKILNDTCYNWETLKNHYVLIPNWMNDLELSFKIHYIGPIDQKESIFNCLTYELFKYLGHKKQKKLNKVLNSPIKDEASNACLEKTSPRSCSTCEDSESESVDYFLSFTSNEHPLHSDREIKQPQKSTDLNPDNPKN